VQLKVIGKQSIQWVCVSCPPVSAYTVSPSSPLGNRFSKFSCASVLFAEHDFAERRRNLVVRVAVPFFHANCTCGSTISVANVTVATQFIATVKCESEYGTRIRLSRINAVSGGNAWCGLDMTTSVPTTCTAPREVFVRPPLAFLRSPRLLIHRIPIISSGESVLEVLLHISFSYRRRLRGMRGCLSRYRYGDDWSRRHIVVHLAPRIPNMHIGKMGKSSA